MNYAEYWESRKAVSWQPEVSLWAAVFQLGVADYFLSEKNPDQRKAKSWLLSDRTDHFGSFVNLCRMFGLDPVEVRKVLKARREMK